MLDITNVIRRECARFFARWARPRHGIVTSYDPSTNSVKVTFQPEGHPSGWIPIQTQGASVNGISEQIGPSIGDLAYISHIEGDPEAGCVTGFKHNDVDRPPGAPSGSRWTHNNPKGTFLHFNADGSYEINLGANPLNITAGAITINGVTISMAATGAVNINGTPVLVNGVPPT